MNIIKLNAIDSTNSYLKQLVRETQLQDETVVVAEKQYSGRGQMGNGWVSKEGQSLTFSVFKTYNSLDVAKQFVISMTVSLAVLEALKTLNIPNVCVKWPNDIMSANKKIGGILIENVLEGNTIKYSVIGIGLNVNETHFENLPQASSLKIETKKLFDLDQVLQKTTITVFKNLQKLPEDDALAIQQIYESELFRKDVISVFESAEGIRFNGIIKGVSAIGELLVETEQTALQKFQLKEVKLVY